VSTGEELRSVPGIAYSYFAGSFSPDLSLVASGRYDGIIELWDTRTGKTRQKIPAFRERSSAVAFNKDGTLLAVAAVSGVVKLCDPAAGRVLHTLEGHTAQVQSLCFSPDGTTLASASDDRTVRLWNVADGHVRTTLRGHTEPVYAVAISPDGSTVASGGLDSTIRFWNAATGETRKTFPDSSGVISLEFNHDATILASGHSSHARLWDVETGRLRCSVAGHNSWVQTLAFSPDGSLLASGDSTGAIQLCDIQTGQPTVKSRAHTSQVYSAVVSPNGSTLVSGGCDGSFRIWNLWDRQTRHVLAAPVMGRAARFGRDGTLATVSWKGTAQLWQPDTGNSLRTFGTTRNYTPLALSPDGATLAAGTVEGLVFLWDVATGQERQTRQSHSRPVLGLAFSPDGKTLATSSEDGTVKLWDAASGDEIHTLERRTKRMSAVAFHPGGRILATGGDERLIRLWDVKGRNELQCLSGHSNGVSSLAFSPDGTLLASASYDCTVRVWDAQSFVERKTIPLSRNHGSIFEVTFTPEGRHLVTANGNGTVYVLRLAERPDPATRAAETNQALPFARVPQSGVIAEGALPLCLDYSRSGHWVLTGSGLKGGAGGDSAQAPAEGYLVKVWNLETGQHVQSFQGHSSPVHRVAFCNEDRQALSFSSDGTIRRWDLQSSKELDQFFVGQGVCGAFSSDRRRALTAADSDKIVRLWDLETHSQLQEFAGHTEAVICAALSDDGTQALSAGGGVYGNSKSGSDYSLRLWNTKTGEQIQRMEGHTDLVHAVAFSPDGRRALSGSWDGTVRIWDLASGQEVRSLLQSAGVFDVAWVDRQRAVASLRDGTVLLLDVETGEELQFFGGHTLGARPLVCSADGQHVVSGSYDRTVRWWRLPPPEPSEPDGDSFVILPRGGREEKGFSTLGRALAAAQGDDVIEIRGNGPFACPTISLTKPVTIRAAAGFSPVLELKANAVQADRDFLTANASLTLEGLEFRRQGMGNPNAFWPQHILSKGADLRVANCRFIIEGSTLSIHAVRAKHSPHVEVRNCQFLGPWQSSVSWDMASGGRLVVDNSIMRGHNTFAYIYLARNLSDVSVALTRNTLVGGELFSIVGGPDLWDTGGTMPLARIESRHNLWDGGVFLVLVYGLKDRQELDAFDDASVLKGWIAWDDQGNAYSQGNGFLRSAAFIGSGPPRSVILCGVLSEWNQFWNIKQSSSLQGEFRFQGGTRVKDVTGSIKLTPEDFRLAPGSAGKAAGPDGSDLGADVDLVGPGPAYERWKKTPEYERWHSQAERTQ
jgi:WD40 repeat protein